MIYSPIEDALPALRGPRSVKEHATFIRRRTLAEFSARLARIAKRHPDMEYAVSRAVAGDLNAARVAIDFAMDNDSPGRPEVLQMIGFIEWVSRESFAGAFVQRGSLVDVGQLPVR